MEIPQEIRKRATIQSRNYILDTYLKEMKTLTSKAICTTTFIALLFTITKTWKQPKGPLTEEWIKKTLYINTAILYSH